MFNFIITNYHPYVQFDFAFFTRFIQFNVMFVLIQFVNSYSLLFNISSSIVINFAPYFHFLVIYFKLVIIYRL